MKRSNARGGFTYVETVMSLAITTVLLLGLSSVMLIGSKAIPTGDEQVHTEASTREALSMIAREIELSTAFERLSSKSFRVTIPDRDDDDASEQITYALTVTSVFTRQWNAGETVELIHEVDSFEIVVQESDSMTEQVKIMFVIPRMTNPSQQIQAELLNMPAVN